MKILLTTDTYENQVCGVSSSIATLKCELINQGHDVRVLLMSRNHKSKIIKDNYLIGSFSLPFIDFRQSFRYNDKVLDGILILFIFKLNGMQVVLEKNLLKNVTVLILILLTLCGKSLPED